jgi:vacuolar fusion protein MON1
LPCLGSALMVARNRLVTMYQTLHDNIHARSGQKGPLKLQYMLTEKESVMGWASFPFRHRG